MELRKVKTNKIHKILFKKFKNYKFLILLKIIHNLNNNLMGLVNKRKYMKKKKSIQILLSGINSSKMKKELNKN